MEYLVWISVRIGERVKPQVVMPHLVLFHEKVLQQGYSLRFGDFALAFYTFVADNYAPIHSQPIECNEGKAPYALNGIVNNESDLNIEEHYTDRGNTNDRAPVMDLVKDLTGKLIGDKGNLSKKLFTQLFDQGITYNYQNKEKYE